VAMGYKLCRIGEITKLALSKCAKEPAFLNIYKWFANDWEWI